MAESSLNLTEKEENHPKLFGLFPFAFFVFFGATVCSQQVQPFSHSHTTPCDSTKGRSVRRERLFLPIASGVSTRKGWT